MIERLYHSTLPSPVGPLQLVSTSRGLAVLALGEGADDWLEVWLARRFSGARLLPAGRAHSSLARQIEEYFAGPRRAFSIRLDLQGSSFQKVVWAEVARIPFGSTVTYAAIASRLGRSGAARAVGAANGANPIPVVIPCHRVVGRDGSLTGYGGGLPIKRWLLAHEGALTREQRDSLS